MLFTKSLIFITLFGLTVTLKCWEDVNVNGHKHTDGKSKQNCASGCDYCMKTVSMIGSVESATWGCGCGEENGPAIANACTSKGRFNYGIGEVNCCKGNLCNSAHSKAFPMILISFFSLFSLMFLK
ncbi:unnamed protein product, partial [Mesorhabditis belari]|uniref:Uncharacterized protein n=1 Tax=Mesorhabditis belari TaxID=2138241 RepID=A0AAF3EF27_9BILA